LLDSLNYQDWKEVKSIKQDGIQILSLPNLEILAGFFGYLKYKLVQQKRKVFCRGERNFHSTTIPKLFRKKQITKTEIKQRKLLLEEVISSLPGWYQANRFKRENVGPLLQHYGIKTYWLDLVDNIFTAAWFALFNNKQEFGYIKFFADRNKYDKMLSVYDLRKNHSSLSLRLHCQHGLSAMRTNSSWLPESIDLADFMTAIVRIPTESRKAINIKKTYMFPNEYQDNTLKYLKKDKFAENLDRILIKNGYAPGFLGKIE